MRISPGHTAINGRFRFFHDCHQPLLIYMYEFLIHYKKTLEEAKRQVQFQQDFLENDVENGLQKVEDVTTGLTDEANSIMKSVNDIVSLPQLDPEEVLHHVQRGKKKTRETVEQLHELDDKQTKALESVEQELTTMKSYITELEGKIRNGDLSISEYDRSIIKNNDVYNEVLGEVNPMHSALNKMKNIYAYIAPYMMMLQPQRMFPVTYRDQQAEQEPYFNDLKKTELYQTLAAKNNLSSGEEKLLQEYLLNLDSNASKDRKETEDDKREISDFEYMTLSYEPEVMKQELPWGPGNIAKGINSVSKLLNGSTKLGKVSAQFADRVKLKNHFEKHGAEFGGIYKNADEYLQGARDVIKNGDKVQYMYKGELRTGYVRFMGTNRKGKAKFEFVGTNSKSEITTYHTQSGKKFWKTINGENVPVINPVK